MAILWEEQKCQNYCRVLREETKGEIRFYGHFLKYYLIHNNVDIIVESEDKQKLIDFRNSLPLVEQLNYTIVRQAKGYLEIERG